MGFLITIMNYLVSYNKLLFYNIILLGDLYQYFCPCGSLLIVLNICDFLWKDVDYVDFGLEIENLLQMVTEI